METQFSKIQPQNLEAEQSILGSILLKENVLNDLLEVISADDFYSPGHRIIYETILDLFEKKQPLDLITLTDALNNTNKLDEVGGAAYLAMLTSVIPMSTNVLAYAHIVKEKAILRRLIKVNTDIATRCFETQGDVDELVEEAEKAIFDITGKKIGQGFTALKDTIPKTLENINELYKKGDLITGVPTGYSVIDKMTAGLQPSDLIILAGRPSMGKTAFAMNIAQHAALVEKKGVAVFSLEMSKEQLTTRLLCSAGKIDSQRLKTGKLNDEDWRNLSRSVKMLLEAPIYIDDTPAITVLEMRSKIRRLASQYELDLIVVDYLQLMRGDSSKRGRGAENRTQEISEISRSLKALAKEHNVPVIALSQLNRGLENRQDKRPMMADLRESGAIEQDADIICFIYRDEVYNKDDDNPDKGIAEIIIGKQRNGPTGTVKLTFLKEFTMFENLSQYSDSDFN